MQTGSSGTLIGWKSGQTTFVPLWDWMEWAWLRTLVDILPTPSPPHPRSPSPPLLSPTYKRKITKTTFWKSVEAVDLSMKRCRWVFIYINRFLSVVPLTQIQKNTNLSAESIVFFNIKRWTVKFSFFEWQISVVPLLSGSTDFNASTLQRTLCPALSDSNISSKW